MITQLALGVDRKWEIISQSQNLSIDVLHVERFFLSLNSKVVQSYLSDSHVTRNET